MLHNRCNHNDLNGAIVPAQLAVSEGTVHHAVAGPVNGKQEDSLGNIPGFYRDSIGISIGFIQGFYRGYIRITVDPLHNDWQPKHLKQLSHDPAKDRCGWPWPRCR